MRHNSRNPFFRFVEFLELILFTFGLTILLTGYITLALIGIFSRKVYLMVRKDLADLRKELFGDK